MPFQFRKEAIEEDLNNNFPSQGQGNPPLYYSLSEVVVPTYSINNVAEGTSLPESLQQAWDFSTGTFSATNTTTSQAVTPGFYKVIVTFACEIVPGGNQTGAFQINDGLGSKTIFQFNDPFSSNAEYITTSFEGIVFARSGDSFRAQSNNNDLLTTVTYRQIATVNGDLVNPLGFSFA